MALVPAFAAAMGSGGRSGPVEEERLPEALGAASVQTVSGEASGEAAPEGKGRPVA